MQVSTNQGHEKREAKGNREPRIARRRHVLAQGTWRETVTHYTPEPWLVALEHDEIGLPVRPGHRPGANR